MDLVLQLLGGFFLLGGLWLGARLWIAPRSESLSWQAKGLLFLVLLTLLGGFIGSPFWWLDEKRAFSWNLPPLASRMLASAGWSFVVAAILALTKPTQGRVRLLLILLAVYLAPLVVLIALFHLDRFDFAAFITWSFFFIAGTMTVACLYFLARTPPLVLETEVSRPPAITRAWLTLVGLVLGAWGLALVVTDSGFSNLIWVWPGDALTSSLIGVMLLAIAAGAIWSLSSRDCSRMMLTVCATYGISVAVANLWGEIQNKPVKELYLVAFALIGATSAALVGLDKLSLSAAASHEAHSPDAS